MSSALLQYLAVLSWVTTLAASLVALVRLPLRRTLGARAAYWLWLAVPASGVALALPRLSSPAGNPVTIAPDVFGWVWARLDALVAAIHLSTAQSIVACVVWALGAGAAIALTIIRQRTFVRSLGNLVASPDGTWRSGGVVEPMLIGALRPRVLVPLDFELRYSPLERELILAHERAHMRRGDTVVNALGAAWLCVFWFNPLMFWAMHALRFDQDLACDAAVLAVAGRGCRSRYANALLKAQLAGEGRLPLPVACHWRSVHPLRRRIAALRPAASQVRHGIAILFVSSLVVGATIVTRAAQPALHLARPAGAYATTRICPIAARRARERALAQPLP